MVAIFRFSVMYHLQRSAGCCIENLDYFCSNSRRLLITAMSELNFLHVIKTFLRKALPKSATPSLIFFDVAAENEVPVL
jgi:hypothetical protein